MKSIIIISLMLIIILLLLIPVSRFARYSPSYSAKQYFITGTYATWERGNLSRSWDTLIVTRDSNDPHEFKIAHHSCFQRTVDPFYYTPVHIHNFWTGYYDPSSHTLTAPAGLPDLVFVPNEYTLTAGGLLYIRIQ